MLNNKFSRANHAKILKEPSKASMDHANANMLMKTGQLKSKSRRVKKKRKKSYRIHFAVLFTGTIGLP